MSLLSESFIAVLRRWNRNLLTLIALALGTATVVTLLALSSSSAAHLASGVIDADDTALSATMTGPEAWLNDDADLARGLEADPAIRGIGTMNLPDSSQRLALTQSRDGSSVQAPWSVATSEGLSARDVRWVAGGMPKRSCASCIVLGRRVAERLSVTTAPGGNTVQTQTGPLTVVGILTDSPRSSALTTAAILPPDTARTLELLPAKRTLAVRVMPGAAEQAKNSLTRVLAPDSIDPIAYAVPPSPQALRARLSEQAHRTALNVTVVTAVSTVFSIVTTMLMAVGERRREIGIDRAMGRTRLRVSTGFLLETIVVGGLGATAGYIAGIGIGAVGAALNAWPFVLPAPALGLPIMGAAVGAAAGMVPAYLASRVRPAELLRG